MLLLPKARLDNFDRGTNQSPMHSAREGLEMKIVFDDGGRGSPPLKACDLCLQQMKFLGDHAECRLFRCALVSTEDVQPQSVLGTVRQAGLMAP